MPASTSFHLRAKVPLLCSDSISFGQIAVVITDGNLNLIASVRTRCLAAKVWCLKVSLTGSRTSSLQGPELVIHQPKELMDGMDEWCKVRAVTVLLGRSDLSVSVALP
ncbi:MAG: hypothetical protein BJ554DRAFT_2265 [Olpidium bornovanus]|uniref:Uncharacterized protein n=1 Tax=Olpidium bornovanus TaxID=278681 RepID=A0A8H7ZQS6_9FUNG|nr:MAG: hypothetical protein BJ554DRAFT_2265 [Olpidium bornovanus]